MEERIRLTKRVASRSRKADAATPETAIDLGKDRTYHKIDEYHTFEPSINHWEPDMRHEWKDNPREETGHGIPKMAKVYMAAKKATKLASMFLGENATEEAIEKQARAFMRMGDKALTATLNRYAECKGEECKEEAPAPAVEAEEEAPAPAPVVEEAPVVEAEEEAPAPAPAPVVEAEEAPVEEAAPVVTASDEEADEDEEADDVEIDDELISTDVDFDEPGDEANTSADPEIEKCFEEADGEEEVAPASEAPVARKAGVKKLAGQPTLTRVASKNADELAGLWDKWTNPDVR
jgi:hypothetical protein